MSMRDVLIIHGWSDTSKSFSPLVDFLKSAGFNAVGLWLGDYISLDDDVKIEDVAKRMEALIRDKQQTKEINAPFDMVVHSTGGLVARQWISTYYIDNVSECPLKRLVKLAPANFGSKLASMGQSLLGRVLKAGITGSTQARKC
jgi:alpha-beta hydrolase superfamily lysophospholipase